MVHKTKGIVLRTVKYGETSVIVTILTELFGLQSYLVNGVRTSSGKGGSKAGLVSTCRHTGSGDLSPGNEKPATAEGI